MQGPRKHGRSTSVSSTTAARKCAPPPWSQAKSRNQCFHHIGLTRPRACMHVPARCLRNRCRRGDASTTCILQMRVLNPRSERCAAARAVHEKAETLSDLSGEPFFLQWIYLQKNRALPGARPSNSLKCAVIPCGAVAVAVFLTTP